MKDSQTDRILAAGIYIISFFTVFIGPLVIWLIKKDSSKLVDYHGRQYFNFLITYFVYGIISTILMLVLIGYLLAAIFGIAFIVFTIIAAVKAFEGEEYRIPFIIRIL
ncbi:MULTISPECIES: DUF4870 domain-containing protein [Cytobacillus]|uniref:DUF4870 domain-containing protein n=1 Tax=Cytobacillus stercorigallinarum TaxID=2762240 RepID=A0ABR8QL54_9BACI|nr:MULTISPECIES: DUF4870 domain-containing protein [Cytobacillus]MBD7936240.1 DUF4870 domain-containing protein [Cytobacillus stercorigallinarum]MCA1027294.1 DUF4870 domain-containing protein [Cytobacillus kochii]MDM5208052.1 DUF4870 domain-containing protein [Cytobacillus kochii]